MPHYRSGLEVKVGDVVQAKDYGEAEYIGVVVRVIVGIDTYNIELAPFSLSVSRNENGSVMFAAPLPYRVICDVEDSEKIA